MTLTEEQTKIIEGKICPYCKSESKLVDSSVIYGKSYGLMYLCEPCDAYVGCHRGTANPKVKIDRCGIMWLKAQTRGEDKKGEKIQGEGWQIKEFERHYYDSYKIFNHCHAIWKEENPTYKPKNLVYPAMIKI